MPVLKPAPVSESLLWAAAELSNPDLELRTARHAVGNASFSIEFHLDTVARELARREVEPRLLGHAKRIESALREALLDAWRAEADMREGVLPLHRLDRLARSLRRITEDEIDLVFEELRDMAGTD